MVVYISLPLGIRKTLSSMKASVTASREQRGLHHVSKQLNDLIPALPSIMMGVSLTEV